MKILVLNPGSTSTKLAVYEDEEELVKQTLTHTADELAKFSTIMDQLDFRYDLVMKFLKEAGYEPGSFDCVMSRGGSPPNVRAGATIIDDNLVEALRERPKEPHPSSLGPIIASRIAKAANIPAYIYDPITADELNPLARVFGMKDMENDGMCHMLNTHAVGISVAEEIGRPFDSLNLIVSHIGGSNSICFWSKGSPTDVVPADANTFSAERCGFMRSERCVQMCEKYGCETIIGWLHGKGGMVSMLGTNDLRDVSKMVENGEELPTLYMRAMAYQMAKCVISLFPVTYGEVDGIVFTGGGAGWVRLMDEIKARLAFLNVPIYLRPGENEMYALASGALRVMRGEELAQTYEG